MILFGLILIPLIGGLLAWPAARWGRDLPRWISLGSLAVTLCLALVLWSARFAPTDGAGEWLAELSWVWIPQLGITFYLAIDGISLVLVILTVVLGLVSVAVSWKGVQTKVGFFHFNLMWVLSGTLGVFLALDLILFFFFWELMIIPMYFLIGVWGLEDRTRAALKFFLFTQLSSLLMLAAIAGLHFVHVRDTGVLTFHYNELLGTPVAGPAGVWLMLGFFVAFAVKLPAFPFHTWLPDAHTQAPTAGSVILAGLMLKTGAYGLLRFAVPLFPEASAAFAPWAMAMGVLGILYGAKMAFAQTDFKRLVAYTSVSHMGFVLLGVYSWNVWALQGVVMQMVCHGLSTGALFILAGILHERLHTRDMGRMGGLWADAPRLGAIGLFFAMASLGLPGLGNFVGEFLILLGTFQVNIAVSALGAAGVVAATVYALAIVARVLHGPKKEKERIIDLSGREMATLGVMVLGLVWLGLYPLPVLEAVEPALETLQEFGKVLEPESLLTLREGE